MDPEVIEDEGQSRNSFYRASLHNSKKQGTDKQDSVVREKNRDGDDDSQMKRYNPGHAQSEQ